MTGSYLFRLLCLSMASFFLVHLALAAALSLLGPAAIRLSERFRPQLAVRLLLLLRLAPTGLSLLMVAGLLACCRGQGCWVEAPEQSVTVLVCCFHVDAVAMREAHDAVLNAFPLLGREGCTDGLE